LEQVRELLKNFVENIKFDRSRDKYFKLNFNLFQNIYYLIKKLRNKSKIVKNLFQIIHFLLAIVQTEIAIHKSAIHCVFFSQETSFFLK